MSAVPAITSQRGPRLFPWISALTVFASALLVFQVQPIIGRMLLPWFGGSPAVWTACLLFFQVMLLAGYTYAHLLAGFRTPRVQVVVHALLVAASLALLPITPSESWKPTGLGHPTLQILLVLAATVGAPYFLLSATAPLVQHWYGRLLPGRSPYRLYALSNAASLLALLSYPLLVEPLFSSPAQGSLWSAGFAAYALLLGVMLAVAWTLRPSTAAAVTTPGGGVSGESPPATQPPQADKILRRNLPLGVQFCAWVLLPALASVLLLAVTNHACQDVPAGPLLWIVPLAIYLITFIVSFDSPRWYARTPFAMAAVLVVLAVSVDLGSFDKLLSRVGIVTAFGTASQGLIWQVAPYFVLLFLIGMLCHGELVRLRPSANRLTAFYLCIAAGGALGGLLVAVVCPLVFTSYLELPLAMLLGLLLAVAVIFDDMGATRKLGQLALGAVVMLGGAYLVVSTHVLHRDSRGLLIAVRNSFGTLQVVQYDDRMLADESLAETSLGGKSTTSASGPPSAPPRETPQFSHPRARMLLNGRIQHGSQFLGEQRKIPTSYYVLTSGIGRTLLSLPQDRARRVGVVGLGTGTLAAYGRGGDFYCFYEINPAVVDLAKQYFTYLSDCPAEQEIVLGDARLSLEREAPRQYDVLALDAFSGDAVPAHLLTDEAFAAYRRHLAPRGVLAVHISNRYLDLEPVVARAALRHRLAIRSVETQESTWLLLAVDAAVFEHEALAGAVTTVPPHDGFPLWTDAYYNTLGILR